jgi:hypothetical protein
METQVNSEKNGNTRLYWLITLVSLVAAVLLFFYSPQWIWLTFPFMTTFFVKAIGMM